MPEQQAGLSAYEVARLNRIAANKLKLQEPGLDNAAAELLAAKRAKTVKHERTKKVGTTVLRRSTRSKPQAATYNQEIRDW